ncbi:integrase arm-type DNA-binding domain-containing protein [Sphingomonas naphthae]|uniref:Integrase arm-type DNA-binding domain-containing protein n=1 Tax=Sphingomonas naphthae TaxID=1813468 RepID=A0ABY7TP43_9SPHN|nr:integrase arm-type DNA-binding domain-containing protein [Sphingomonas naphthae]WCT75007.1 integrase arm-type DNA-binding domain-containing protein [Sphingomonas naphthae]
MLSDTQCRRAKAIDKPVKLSDEKGLYLFVTPAGGRIWRLKYRFAGKEKKLVFGPYPEVSLAEARDLRDEARRLLRDHHDPAVTKKAALVTSRADNANTFELIATQWHALNKGMWATRHAEDVIHSLKRDVFPAIGALPIRDIKTPKVLELLRAIEARPAIETAKRVRQRISAVFVYAIGEGIADDDPAAVVKSALKPLHRGKQPAITDLVKARKVLADAEAEDAHPVTKLALRLLALTAVRPGELRGARWDEIEGIDWSDPAAQPVEPLWRIPAARMKGRLTRKEEVGGDHLVPLSRQAIDVLRTAYSLSGRGPLPFPNARHSHRPMSENAIGYLLNRAGYHHRHVPHGWRATFSTIMNERFKADHDIIELMLAHVAQNKVKAAYDRAAHLDRRRELAQLWADLIADGLRPAAEVIIGPRR